MKIQMMITMVCLIKVEIAKEQIHCIGIPDGDGEGDDWDQMLCL